MQITGAEIAMSAAHAAARTETTRERLRVRLPDPPQTPLVDRAVLSDGVAAASEDDASGESLPLTADELELELLRVLLERLTGRRFDTASLRTFRRRLAEAERAGSPADTPTTAGNGPRGFGLEYDRVEQVSETEALQFSATGVIRTADGRQIDVAVGLSLSRAFVEEHRLHVEAGDTRALKDPLVLDFGGTGADLPGTRFSFDLDSDGRAEQVPLVGAGSGLLALDADGNGRIDDGGELFGPRTGDGFAELAALDGDRSGWIDAGDDAYGRLRVWTPSAAGAGSLSTLAERGVGAIGLQQAATPFDVKDAVNTLVGVIRRTGLYLADDGTVHLVQQIDFTA